SSLPPFGGVTHSARIAERKCGRWNFVERREPFLLRLFPWLPVRSALRYFFWQMPTVAEQLRQGREAMKLDVHQVAESTKLKTDQIRALEQGNYDDFTACVYLRGSTRTYANLLKL